MSGLAPPASSPGSPPAAPVERFLGRLLAHCVHPYAAWRLSRAAVRAGIVATYVLAGFVGGLMALFLVP